MFYIVFAIGLFLSKGKDKNHVKLKIFTLILAILAFFRYGIGADYFAYMSLYDRLQGSLVNEIRFGLDNQEFLFKSIGVILKSIGLSYQQYLAVLASVNIYFIYKTCKKYSKNPRMSMLLYYSFYYLVWTFSGLRQGLTLAIGLFYLLKCIETNNTKKIIFVSLILTTIHASSIILIPLYFFGRMKFRKSTLISLLVISLFIAILPVARLISVFDFIPIVSRMQPYFNQAVSITNIFDFQSIGRIFFVTIILIYYDAYKKEDPINANLMNIYIGSIIIYFIFKSSELTAARLSLYGKVLDIVLLTNIIYLYRQSIKKIIYISALICLSFVYLNKEMKTMEIQSGINYEHNRITVPYTNLFNKDDYVFDKNTLSK